MNGLEYVILIYVLGVIFFVVIELDKFKKCL